jgi:diaminopimelate epimerase
MAGGGNDFLVFEADGRRLSDEDRARLARLCRRGMSVGADGALFLSGGEESRIHLDYFNADGGLASFCANGTRCAARYAVTRRLVSGREAVLETGWAPIAARVHESDGDPATATVTLSLPLLPKPGDAIPLDPEARAAPEGANVNFVAVTAPDSLAVRTFERGVEGETLACGSGVVAAAVVAASAGRVAPPVVCETRSGVHFTVSLSLVPGSPVVAGAALTGDAREIFTAELTEEAWLA